MPEFKVVFTIEVNATAADHDEAHMIALDYANLHDSWSNADVEVLEKGE